MDLTTPSAAIQKVAAVGAAAVLLLATTACGSGDNGNATGPTGEQGAPPARQQGGSDGAFPGANGKVAAVDGRTAQVQGMDGQVAVTWTGATTFTKEVSAALSDVDVGDCVFVGSDQEASGSTPATEVTAATVRITRKTNGSCRPVVSGPGGGSDAGPQVGEGPAPDDGAPSGAPSGAPGGARPRLRGFGGAVGQVTAVSATGFTVASAVPGGDGSDTTTVTVTVGADTSYTATAKGAAADVEVGVCVAATGTTDDTGAVTARTIAVSQPQDGQCGGFARFTSGDGAGTKES